MRARSFRCSSNARAESGLAAGLRDCTKAVNFAYQTRVATAPSEVDHGA